jgi:hypothetical protein
MAISKNFAQSCKRAVRPFFENREILVRYARDEDGNPYGVVVGVRRGDNVIVGHSVCNRKKDNFSRHVGIYIALQRALKDNYSIQTDSDLTHWYDRMRERGEKYWHASRVMQNVGV